MYPIGHTAVSGRRPSRFRRFRAPLAWLTASALVAALLAALLSGAPASGASASVAFVQGTTFDTGKLTSTTVSLGKPVPAGDLLVGWFAQYGSSGQVQVSDSVNGAWTRASGTEQFGGSSGDIALYYLAGSKAAAGGLTITVSASAAAYLQGTVAEYSGVAASSPLGAVAVSRGTSTAVNTGATTSVAAGQLVYAAEVTGVSPGAVPAPGSSAGVTYTERASTSSGSAFEEDITSGSAGAQAGTATLAKSTDWYAVAATFTPASATTSPSPTPTTTSPSPTPTTTSPTPTPTTTSPTPTPTTTSPTPTPTTSSTATPPPASVAFVQGTTFDTGKLTSTTVSLGKPVPAGDLLVGWFAQYGSSGQVQVSDSVNGAWTRASGTEQFGGSSGDIALYYLAGSKAAAGGLTITVSASAAAYLQGTVAEYSGVAASSPLGAVAVSRGTSTAVNTGATTSVAAGQLVYAAEVTGVSPGAVPAPGSSAGVTYTERASTSSGSAFEEDITSGSAGAQAGTATLAKSTDWYAVAATFTPASATTSPSPTPTTTSPSPTPTTTSPTPTPTTTSPTPTPTTTSPTPTPTTTGPASGITKVLVIMDENQSDIDVFPSGSNSMAAMPYLWALAQEYGYATNWSDIEHPSQPNYLAIFAGTPEGDPDDCDPGPGCQWPGPTVMSQAIAAGGTAKIYEEGMTANCQTSNPGYYDVNHNPWAYFTDSTDEAECAVDDVPSGTTTSGALLSDINSGNLPTVGLLKPDLANDSTDSTIATADSWLQSWVPLIQSGPDWKAGRLAIVVTFDESDQGAGGENVPFVMIAPGMSGVLVSQALNHYALTRFLDEVAGASLLGNAGTEPDIAPLFGVQIGTLSAPVIAAADEGPVRESGI